MDTEPRFSRAEAERRLGPAAVEAIRRAVDLAPPLTLEQLVTLRRIFQSARQLRA